MTTFKYLSALVLTIALIGCQSDTPEKTPQQQSPQQQQPQQQQQQPQQQPGQMGQMQQQAPDVDLSDEEAGQFADAAINAQEIQKGAQKKMVGIIKDEGLDIETYQKIAKSSQMGQSPEESNVTESQMEKFKSASESINEAQQEIQQEITAAIEETGMEVQRFQTINQAVRQDPELQKQIQQKIQEKVGGPGMQQPPQNN